MGGRDIVFDLDGTLIDSAASILASIQAAFVQVGITPCGPLTPALIGPPLAQTLGSLVPDAAAAALPALIDAFKTHYDEAGHRQAHVYSGVKEMLRALAKMPLQLHIATNKRILPARRIVEYLGWERVFAGVYALDFYTPALASKAAMLENLRRSLSSMDRPGTPIYIGDRAEDAQAAKSSGMDFLWASWGYGGEDIEVAPEKILHSPMDLVQAIERMQAHW